MPITQSRMLSLLNAARDYEQALHTATSYVKSISSLVESGQRTPLQAISDLRNMAEPAHLLTDPLNSPKAIALEAAHFTLSTQRRNTRVAEKQRTERLSTFVPHTRREQRQGNRSIFPPTPTTSPDSLVPPLIPALDYDIPDEKDLNNPVYQRYLASKAREEREAALQRANPEKDIKDLDEDLKSLDEE